MVLSSLLEKKKELFYDLLLGLHKMGSSFLTSKFLFCNSKKSEELRLEDLHFQVLRTGANEERVFLRQTACKERSNCDI